MDCVRYKQWQVTEIAYPVGIQAALEWRPRGAAEWNQLDLGSEEDVAGATRKVSEKLVSEINARLQDHSCDVHLDFGDYGRYYAAAAAVIIPTQTGLPPALRKQIIWFCKRSKVFFAGRQSRA